MRWEASGPNAVSLMSHNLNVGFVIRRTDGSVAWQLSAVFCKYITKGSGEVKDFAAGKRALRRSWNRWRKYAGLMENGGT